MESNSKNSAIVQLLTPCMLAIAFTLISPANVAFGKGDTQTINISGTVPEAGDGEILRIVLKNGNDQEVASTTYTGNEGDDELDVAGKLEDNFTGAGFRAKRGDRKQNGDMPVVFTRKRTGGQAFNVEIATNEVGITASTKSSDASFSVSPSSLDLAGGTAMVSLTGTGTVWSTSATGVFFSDDINVDSVDIVSDTLIEVDLSWDSPQCNGFEHVMVLGDDSDDPAHDGSVDPSVVISLSDTAVAYTGGLDPSDETCSVGFQPIPSVSDIGLFTLVILMIFGAMLVLRGRNMKRA